MSVAIAPGCRIILIENRGDCDESLARQDSGWLSVSGLGAVSAESYGRDSFAESAGLGQLRFGPSAQTDSDQTERK